MQVIGKHDDRIHPEWPLFQCSPERVTQAPDFTDKQNRAPVRQCDGEENRGARNQGAKIVRHEKRRRGYG